MRSFFSVIFRGLKWYMRTLQMIVHLPMLRTIMPPNATTFFKYLIPAVMFDILDSDWLDLVWEFDY